MTENRIDRTLALFYEYSTIQKNLLDTIDEKITILNRYQDYRIIRNFKTIIFFPNSTTLLTSDRSVLEKELLNALEEGSHVCFLCDEGADQDGLIRAILLMVGSSVISFSNKISEIIVKQPEFREFLKSYGIASNVFEINAPYESAICTMRYILTDNSIQQAITKYENEAIVGFTIKKQKGLLTFLPFHLISDNFGTERIKAVLELIKALDTHRKNRVFEAPNWIDQVNTKMESEIKGEISKLTEEMRSRQIIIDKQFDLKSILRLKHDKLVEKCMAVLENMRIDTNKNDIGEEDFWILNDNKEQVMICECKGKDKDLTRPDINELDTHRIARGKSEDFPGLFIVNSYNKANSIQEKDMTIPSNVIKHAVNMNVLVLRSLDLYRLLDFYERGLVTTEKILSDFKTQKGWMRVTSKIDFLIK